MFFPLPSIYLTPFANELLESKLVENGLLGRADITICDVDSVVDLNPFEVELISMSHSIPESCALRI